MKKCDLAIFVDRCFEGYQDQRPVRLIDLKEVNTRDLLNNMKESPFASLKKLKKLQMIFAILKCFKMLVKNILHYKSKISPIYSIYYGIHIDKFIKI